MEVTRGDGHPCSAAFADFCHAVVARAAQQLAQRCKPKASVCAAIWLLEGRRDGSSLLGETCTYEICAYVLCMAFTDSTSDPLPRHAGLGG